MKIDTRTDATTSGLRYYRGEPPRGTSDLILAYVPESEHLTYNEALVLAEVRDRQAAEQLRLSVPDSERLSGPVEHPHLTWALFSGEWTGAI